MNLNNSDVPLSRINADTAPVRGSGEYVLYWMVGTRRLRDNFALDRALDWCRHLRRPLVILEALRAGYTHANDRHHTFVLEGMRENFQQAANAPVTYLAYVERAPGEGKGLLDQLSSRAAVVVTDDSPVFFLPRLLEAVRPRLGIRTEAIDSLGLLPASASPKAFPTAYAFRRHLQRTLPEHLLASFPRAEPFRGLEAPSAPDLTEVRARWDFLNGPQLDFPRQLAASCAIDHSVSPVPVPGGPGAAQTRLQEFLETGLDGYLDRSHPDARTASGLSPHLHYGHISTHQIFAMISEREDWTPERLGKGAAGKRAGWWGMSPAAEAFLDQVVTWRELGQVFVRRRPEDHSLFEGLPDWAQKTLNDHAGDPREYCYSLEEFERAETHDEIWNAAQRELVRTGTIQNYFRMLWGKKILHWTKSPQEALRIMLYLNDKYALDGRDPNSISGITWVLGRFDRAWGPVRPIFGKIRYMTCAQAKRKLRCKEYLAEFAAEAPARLF